MTRHIEPNPAIHPSRNRRITGRLAALVCLFTMLGACSSSPEPRPNTLYEPQPLNRTTAQTGIQTNRLLPPTAKPPASESSDEAAELADNPQPSADPLEPVADASIDTTPEPPRLTAIDLQPLQDRAQQGDIDAQYQLGDLLQRGVQVEQNLPLAADWLAKAAKAGDHRAQYALGQLFYNGRGYPTDYDMARNLWLDSAVQGNDLAQLKLGYMYSEGIGVSQDYNAAQRWYLKSASMGNAEAQTLLGSLLHEGNRIEHDYDQAFKWYKMAAEQGHAHAQYTLGTLFHDGLGTPVDYIRCSAWVDVAVSNGYNDHLGAKGICRQAMDTDGKLAAEQMANQLKAQYGPQRAGLL